MQVVYDIATQNRLDVIDKQLIEIKLEYALKFNKSAYMISQHRDWLREYYNDHRVVTLIKLKEQIYLCARPYFLVSGEKMTMLSKQ